MGIDRDEAVEGLGDTADPRTSQQGQRHDAISSQDGPVGQKQLAVAGFGGVRPRVDTDSPRREHRAHRFTGVPAEKLQRLVLGSDEDDVQIHAPSRRPPRGHQRELVGGNAPSSTERHDKGDPADSALTNLAEQLHDLLRIRRPAERQRTVDSLHGNGTTRDQKQRILHGTARLRVGDASRGIHGHESPEGDGCPCLRCEGREVKAAHPTEGERLGHGHGPIPEARLGCEKPDIQTIVAERLQRERSLERSNTSTGDQHVYLLVVHVDLLFGSRPCMCATPTDPRPFTPPPAWTAKLRPPGAVTPVASRSAASPRAEPPVTPITLPSMATSLSVPTIVPLQGAPRTRRMLRWKARISSGKLRVGAASSRSRLTANSEPKRGTVPNRVRPHRQHACARRSSARSSSARVREAALRPTA